MCHPAEQRFAFRTVPLGGGIAIFITLVLLIPIAAAAVISAEKVADGSGETARLVSEGILPDMPQVAVISACMAGLFALGLVDDIFGLGPFVKLLVQATVALAAAAGGVRVELFIDSTVVTTLLSACWMVFLINAFNFLDNMDGLSAGVAVIASCILLAAAAIAGQLYICCLAAVFIGAVTGFLVWNFPPAKIFMGDAGSLVVGFLVAVLTLRTTYYHQAENGRWHAVFLPLVIMAVPLYDFVSVTCLRIAQGNSPFAGDTQHFSHRLKRRGLGDVQVVLTLYLATLATGLGGIILSRVDLTGAILVFCQTLMVMTIVAILETASRNVTNED